MNFSEYAGNARAVETLRRMLASDRLPPALLLTGPRGVGKFTCATLLARAANCLEQDGEICGHCEPCRALVALDDIEGLRKVALEARGSGSPESNPLILRPHSNVTVLVPDGAFIRVSQMRYLLRQVRSVPTGSGRTLFLIDEAERLRFDYADVLLKVLEEPPPRTSLMLITHEPFKLRPTIRSRCIPVYFAPLSTGEVASQLRTRRPEWKKAERELAAAASAGNLGWALRLDLDDYRHTRRYALELLRNTALSEILAERLFAATAELVGKAAAGSADARGGASGAEKFDFILEILYSLLNDVLYLMSGEKGVGLRNPDVAKELSSLASTEGEAWVAGVTRNLDRIDSWRRRNVSRQLALDSLATGFPPPGQVA